MLLKVYLYLLDVSSWFQRLPFLPAARSALSWIAVPDVLAEGLRDEQRISFVLISVCCLEAVFWTAILLYMVLIDRLNLFGLKRYAIKQTQPYPSREIIVECFQDVLFGHFLMRPIMLFFAYPYLKLALDFGTGLENFPSWLTIAWQFVVCMQVDDFLFYWLHRLCHVGWFYKHIHKKHHQFKHTIAIAVEWAHPVEELVVNTIPTVLGAVLLRTHVTVFWLYICIKLWQSVDAHSGYSLPFPLSPFTVPLLCMDCAPAHYFHHSVNIGNYGGYFIFWDWLCGTNEKYMEINAKHLVAENRKAQ